MVSGSSAATIRTSTECFFPSLNPCSTIFPVNSSMASLARRLRLISIPREEQKSMTDAAFVTTSSIEWTENSMHISGGVPKSGLSCIQSSRENVIFFEWIKTVIAMTIRQMISHTENEIQTPSTPMTGARTTDTAAGPSVSANDRTFTSTFLSWHW